MTTARRESDIEFYGESRLSVDLPWEGFLAPMPGVQQQADSHAFRGKRILITGAGGYIGSALAHSLQTYLPAQLVLLDSAEHGLYRLEQFFAQASLASAPVLVVGSVNDETLVQEIFALYRPQLVFHAAALKHVPLMEANPLSAIATNVFGMQTIAKAAIAFGAERLMLLSTDKAVDPISIMGASKRVAEQITLANASGTAMTALRLCNVLGSSGSVAPHFVRQICEQRPITVTHPDATRYFLSLTDTTRLLLLAATRTGNAELLIPRLPAPSRILDLARYLLSHLTQDQSAEKVTFTQLRCGDKVHERMFSARESVHGGEEGEALLTVESPAIDRRALDHLLLRMREGLRRRERSSVLRLICEAVPEYTPDIALQPGLESQAR